MTANHRAANIESAEERGYWKGYHAAIRKCDAETIKMLDMELLAKSGKQLKGVIVPIIEKARQEAYAKGQADLIEKLNDNELLVAITKDYAESKGLKWDEIREGSKSYHVGVARTIIKAAIKKAGEKR